MWILIAILIICIGIVFDMRETFDAGAYSDTRDFDIDNSLVSIYNELLERHPNRLELIKNRRAILAGSLSLEDVRQRLMDSNEYGLKIKLQSNELTPELPKMISDSRLLRKLVEIYKEERLKTCPPKIVIPLKEMFIKLNYNENALRYMLQSHKWTDFEQDILLDDDFSSAKLMDLMQDTYGGPAKIAAEAQSVPVVVPVARSHVNRMINDTDSDSTVLLNNINQNAQQIFNKDAVSVPAPTLVKPKTAAPEASPSSAQSASLGTVTTAPPSMASKPSAQSVSPATVLSSTVSNSQTPASSPVANTKPTAQTQLSAPVATTATVPTVSAKIKALTASESPTTVYPASAAAPATVSPTSVSYAVMENTGDYLPHKEVPVRQHYGDMVLRPELAWTIPQQYPQVCTTFGQPPLVQPVVLESSTAMNATPLGEAADTGVGSIMPAFKYKEYIHL